MDQSYQKKNHGGYYCPKRIRSDSSYIRNSANQNPYRKPASNKKSYVKKHRAQKYSFEEIMKLQQHTLSLTEPNNPFVQRKVLSSNGFLEASWRHVPKVIKSDLDALTKSLKSLLNKLTPTNLDQIRTKIAEFFTRETSKIFSVMLLGKACMEFKYSETYCLLSKALISLFPYFREDLLQACQNIFESDICDSTDEALNKRKMLGLVGFIGELMNARILSTKVLMLCCELLLKKNTEQTAEGVCYLLSVCSGAFSSKYKEMAHNFIQELQERSINFSSRIKFQIIDLVESNKIHCVIFQQKEKPQKIRTG